MAEIHPPIGTIIAYAGNFVPDKKTWETKNEWMVCDGRPLKNDDAKYVALFKAIGSSWGGDGANMFNLPDIQGYFLRGVSGNSGKDPNANERRLIKAGGHSGNDVGSIQDSAIQEHTHPLPSHRLEAEGGSGFEGNGHAANSNPNGGYSGQHNSRGVDPPTIKTSETRPLNAYVHWIIRWK